MRKTDKLIIEFDYATFGDMAKMETIVNDWASNLLKELMDVHSKLYCAGMALYAINVKTLVRESALTPEPVPEPEPSTDSNPFAEMNTELSSIKVHYIPYQKCPKCDGQGTVSKPPYIAGDVYQWSATQCTFTCDVCNGAKIIPMFKQKI